MANQHQASPHEGLIVDGLYGPPLPTRAFLRAWLRAHDPHPEHWLKTVNRRLEDIGFTAERCAEHIAYVPAAEPERAANEPVRGVQTSTSAGLGGFPI